MDDLKPTDLARLAHYFAGELPPDEAALVAQRIEANSDLQNFTENLRRSRIDMSSNASEHIPDVDSQVDLLANGIATALSAEQGQKDIIHENASSHRVTSRIRNKSLLGDWFSPRYSGYGVVALVASLVLVFMGWKLSESRQGMLSADSISSYATGKGERATVTLPDGSQVVLNVGSRVQIPSDFASGNRIVTLSGQAFFSVAAHSDAPFTVISGPSVTRVLGTQFSVRYYETDTAATVVVKDGKVSVGSVVVNGGQEVSVSSYETSAVRIHDMNALSFTKGLLVLNNISLLDAIPDLNRWYNVEIRLGDPIFANKEIAGGFESGSIFDLIALLEPMYDARIVRDGRVLTLYR